MKNTELKQIGVELSKSYPNLSVHVREEQNEIVAIAKSISFTKESLSDLAKMIGKNKLTFGRSGANCRMIIH